MQTFWIFVLLTLIYDGCHLCDWGDIVMVIMSKGQIWVKFDQSQHLKFSKLEKLCKI
jgi:hypothetical protein